MSENTCPGFSTNIDFSDKEIGVSDQYLNPNMATRKEKTTTKLEKTKTFRISLNQKSHPGDKIMN